VTDGTISRAVLYGVLGLSARFSKDAETRLQGEAFSLESKQHLKADLENLCLENVQACILVGNICGGEGNNDIESLYFGICLPRRQHRSLNNTAIFRYRNTHG
jgi:hypothetical protein